jgi:hypothetical protein
MVLVALSVKNNLPTLAVRIGLSILVDFGPAAISTPFLPLPFAVTLAFALPLCPLTRITFVLERDELVIVVFTVHQPRFGTPPVAYNLQMIVKHLL